MERRGRERQAERLSDEARDLFRKHLQGFSVREVARKFRVSERTAYRRMEGIPEYVREALIEEQRQLRQVQADITTGRMERRLSHAR